MNRYLQLAALWAGPSFIIVLVPTFYMMGFLPPVPPSLTALEVAAYYEENRTQIRLGATMIIQGGILMYFFVAAIAVLMRRIERNGRPILTYAQMLFGLVVNLVFLLMGLAWTVAAYRPDRNPELVLMLNDFGWFAFLLPVFPLMLQALVIGLAILTDEREKPLFPRWSGYLNLWIGLAFLPGAAAPFFTTGPFAWNGLFVYWVPIVAFIGWVFVMAWVSTNAINTPDEEELQN